MANTKLAEAAAIVGAYEHPTRFAPDKSEWQLLAEASRGAIRDAGLSKNHIDALFVAATAPEGGQLGLCTSTMAADYLNLKPKYIDETDIGGASLGYYVNRAGTWYPRRAVPLRADCLWRHNQVAKGQRRHRLV